ncbi:hypothetical protein BT96DRAFT_776130, partial [Gymnopus androsaceus JB14]
HNSISVSGPIAVGKVYQSLEDGIKDVYAYQEQVGYKWRRAQSKKDVSGDLYKLTLRCHQYGEHTSSHLPDIDPAEFRVGKSARSGCSAHVNVRRHGSLWRITLAEWDHNHARYIPEGGTASRPPTKEQRKMICSLANANGAAFSRSHLSSILNAQSVGHPLEPRQIGNVLNASRRQARDEVAALGGDVHAI